MIKREIFWRKSTSGELKDSICICTALRANSLKCRTEKLIPILHTQSCKEDVKYEGNMYGDIKWRLVNEMLFHFSYIPMSICFLNEPAL